jgi:four helix bundle protein
MTRQLISRHHELQVYEMAFVAAMLVFEMSQGTPEEEWRSLQIQMVQSSRSVCVNVARAWQKRRYREAFVAKLNEAEALAAETQTWLEFAVMCSYVEAEAGQEMIQRYNEILTALSRMIHNADAWTV